MSKNPRKINGRLCFFREINDADNVGDSFKLSLRLSRASKRKHGGELFEIHVSFDVFSLKKLNKMTRDALKARAKSLRAMADGMDAAWLVGADE